MPGGFVKWAALSLTLCAGSLSKLALAVPPPTSPYPDDADTVALWHMDGDGSNAASSASAQAVIQLRPGAAFSSDGGRFGGALQVNNAGAFINDLSIPELDALLATTHDFTIEAWVRPALSDVDGTKPTTGILEHYKGDDGAGAFRRAFDWRIDNLAAGVAGRPDSTKGLIYFRSGDQSCICTSINGGIGLLSGDRGVVVPLSADTWHHVAFVRQGTTLSQWVDGQIVSTLTVSADWKMPDSDQPLIFGAVETFIRPMSGQIDEVRISKVARWTPPPPPGPCDLPRPSLRTHLFLDDCEIAAMSGLERVFHPAVKRGVVKGNEMPWETGSGGNFVQVFKEGETFHMYYSAIYWDPTAGPPDDASQQYRCFVCYATSTDGLNWTRPVIGRIPMPASSTGAGTGRMEPVGSTMRNNALFSGQLTAGCYDPARRVGKRILLHAHGQGFVGSNDWLNFSPVGRTPPRTNIFGWLYNQEDGIWEVFTQGVFGAEFPRMIGRHYSHDLSNWVSHASLSPDALDHQLPEDYDEYMAMSGRRMPGLTIGFNNVFHGDRTDPRYSAPGGYAWRKGTVDIQLVCSRDGRTWTHLGDRQPWIPHGPEEHSYDRLVLMCNSGVRVGDELWFYYEAWDGDHLTYDAYGQPYYPDGRIREGRVALATIRLDGYVSVRAGDQEGTLTTQPLAIKGGRLRLNVNAAGGTALAELLDDSGQPIAGFTRNDCEPIRADSVKQSVYWNGSADLSPLGARTVRIRFTVQNADLYGFTLAAPGAIPGDCDGDGDVDQDDFGQFQRCFAGSQVPQTDPACTSALLDDDAFVDLNDLGIFKKCRSGPTIPADPDCGGKR